MELHRLIFRLDYPKAFKIFGLWGDIFSELESCEIWPTLGEDPISRAIVASGEDKSKNKVYTLRVSLNETDGAFERHPIPSHRDFDDAFQRVSRILALLELKEYQRVGVRFLFLEPMESFENALKPSANQVSAKYWELFEHDLTDISIVSIHGVESQSLRLAIGPLKRAEYANWFGAPSEIKEDNALLFDVDCFARSYKDLKLDLRKLVAVYYVDALKQAEKVLALLTSGR